MTEFRNDRQTEEDKMREIGNKGFTLIELLVVVAIIGILAAIAIPQFAAYRQKGFDARAEADLRNFATAEEAYFVTNNTYVATTCDASGGNVPVWNDDLNVACSGGVKVDMALGNPNGFTGTSVHDSGAYTWNYDSNQGGITAPTAK
jgi:type IV pilus assembly protein PilA